MKQGGKSFNSFFVFLIMLVLVVAVLSLFSEQRNGYTRADFMSDLEGDKIEELIIQPNEIGRAHV